MTVAELDQLARLEEKVDGVHEMLKSQQRLLHGEGTTRGLLARVDVLDALVMGTNGQPGLSAKVQVLWSTYVFAWCTAAAAAGSFLTWIVTRLS